MLVRMSIGKAYSKHQCALQKRCSISQKDMRKILTVQFGTKNFICLIYSKDVLNEAVFDEDTDEMVNLLTLY
jgi:hypothetical protein